MEPAFTLGILYGCGRGFRTAQYFEQLAAYYLKSMSRVRVLIALTGKAERSVAACLLEQRAKHSGLEVAVVLTARQWRAERFSPPELLRLFIERCDLLVFQEHHAGVQMVGLLRELLTDMAVPLPVQYELLHPGYASLHYPADRKQYRIYGGPYYDPYQEIRQSVAYLRRNNFVIRAEHLPMIFVRKWQSAPPGWYHYLTTPDDTDMIFRLRETPRHDHLSLKVFAYAYAVRHDMWAGGRETPSGADAIRRFRQFRQLLEIIAARREAGERVESFDLMDFDEYDKMLRQNR